MTEHSDPEPTDPESLESESESADRGWPSVPGDVGGYSPNRRWFPARLGGLGYLVVMAATLVGLGVVATGAWRNGVRLVAVALILAAILRATLPEPQAGMLAVRHRFLDAGILAVVGAVVIFLASSIPNQPPL
jgi:Protein of unknown function (DUF3017)